MRPAKAAVQPVLRSFNSREPRLSGAADRRADGPQETVEPSEDSAALRGTNRALNTVLTPNTRVWLNTVLTPNTRVWLKLKK